MGVKDEEIRLEFLVSGSYDALPSSYLKLRSYLNIHSSNLAKLHDLKLPKCFTKTNLICKQCFLPWSGDTCSIKLLPEKKLTKNSKNAKVDSSKAYTNLNVRRNHLVLKCKICNNRSHFYFVKTLPKFVKIEKVIVKDKNKIERKKKKKKKDKMCGLKTTIKKCEPPKNSTNITKSSGSKPSKAAETTANINKKVQKVKQVQVKKSHSVSGALNTKTHHLPVRKKKHHIDSHATNLQSKSPKNKNKKLEKLKKFLQREKLPVNKTLKDFLTLI